MCKECKIFTEKGKYYCPESMDYFKYCPFCGKKLIFNVLKVEHSSLIDYIKSLDKPETYDKWRYAYELWVEYHNNGKNPDDYIDEIIKKVEKKFKTK